MFLNCPSVCQSVSLSVCLSVTKTLTLLTLGQICGQKRGHHFASGALSSYSDILVNHKVETI